MDIIHIRDLHASTLIGLYPEERAHPRPIYLNVSLFLNTRKAAQTDNIHYTVDYDKAVDRILSILKESQFKLLEALADSIAVQLLDVFPIQKISITIEKPNFVPNTRSVAVEITRTKT